MEGEGKVVCVGRGFVPKTMGEYSVGVKSNWQGGRKKRNSDREREGHCWQGKDRETCVGRGLEPNSRGRYRVGGNLKCQGEIKGRQ